MPEKPYKLCFLLPMIVTICLKAVDPNLLHTLETIGGNFLIFLLNEKLLNVWKRAVYIKWS